MLASAAIRDAMKLGEITIRPFVEKNLQPNSYDVTLGAKLLQLTANQHFRWDDKHPVRYVTHDLAWMQSRGVTMTLKAGHCYLGVIAEHIQAPNLIMMLHGRSTLARCFLQIHQTAGFGDIGFEGHWTLEMRPAFDIDIQLGMRIAQIAFIEPVGEPIERYQGRYTTQKPIPKLPDMRNH